MRKCVQRSASATVIAVNGRLVYRSNGGGERFILWKVNNIIIRESVNDCVRVS